MSAYQHGIRVEEVATRVPQPQVCTSGINMVFGTAPINLAKNPSANKLVLAHTFEEAKEALGYSEDFDKYTLCQSMYYAFKKYKVAPVIFVNVLDPATHKTAVEETSVTVTNKQATIDVLGMLMDALVVKKDTTELTIDTDYVATFNDEGKVVITLLSSGTAATANTLKVSGFKIDASKVTDADIIGGYDESTGVETGLELIRQVYPTLGITPGLILAPGYSKKKNIAAVMESKCEEINGCFSCVAVIDVDTAQATKYTSVEMVKTSMGTTGKNTILLWPMVKSEGKVLAYSAAFAAMTQALDAGNDDVPSLSPSNKALDIEATVLADGTEVILDEVQANTLNAIGVVTALNMNGFRSWGNNTACYPGNTDPKDRWISCRRFFVWWENNFITTYHEQVDGNASYRFIESIVDAENIKGNSYKAQDKCAGAYIEFIQEENPIENILDGHMVFRMHLAPYTPAEDILNVFEFDVDALSTALGGE